MKLKQIESHSDARYKLQSVSTESRHNLERSGYKTFGLNGVRTIETHKEREEKEAERV